MSFLISKRLVLRHKDMEYKNENDLVKDILFNLHELNRIHPTHRGQIYAWQNNTGGYEREDSSRRRGGRFIRYGHVGSGDILGSYHGTFFSIEAKFGRNKVTQAQKEFIEAINQTGGKAFEARSWQDVEKGLDI